MEGRIDAGLREQPGAGDGLQAAGATAARYPPIQPRAAGSRGPAGSARCWHRDGPRAGHAGGRAGPGNHRLQQHPAGQLGSLPLRGPGVAAAEADDRPGSRLQRRDLPRRALGRVHLRAQRESGSVRARSAESPGAAAVDREPGDGGRGGLFAGRPAAALRRHARRQCGHLRDPVPAREIVRRRPGDEPDAARRGRLQPGLLARRHADCLFQQPRHVGVDEHRARSARDLPGQRAVRDAVGRERRAATHAARELGRSAGVDA